MQSLSPSVISLILANLVPLYGVLFLGWQVFPVIFLFWLENVIVGFINVFRLIFCRSGQPMAWLAKIFMVPFFCFHYGMFCFVHGIFVVALFGKDYLPGVDIKIPDFISLPFILFKYEPGLIYAALALLLSHALSFVYNYLKGGEYKQASLDKLMSQPYARIVMLHITLLAGGFLIMALKSPAIGVFTLVVLKIIIDLKAHMREHKIESSLIEAGSV